VKVHLINIRMSGGGESACLFGASKRAVSTCKQGQVGHSEREYRESAQLRCSQGACLKHHAHTPAQLSD